MTGASFSVRRFTHARMFCVHPVSPSSIFLRRIVRFVFIIFAKKKKLEEEKRNARKNEDRRGNDEKIEMKPDDRRQCADNIRLDHCEEQTIGHEEDKAPYMSFFCLKGDLGMQCEIIDQVDRCPDDVSFEVSGESEDESGE